MPKRYSINSIIPSLITLFSCCAGLTAIRYALDGQIAHSLFFILIAGALDGLDGTVARWLKATSQFGGELDSLADFVAFGVAPGLIIYYTTSHTIPGAWGWFAALIFILCCGLRLARFNATNLSPISETQAVMTKPEPFFRGVPAPAGGIVGLMPLALLQEIPSLASWPYWAWGYILWQVFIGLLMVSNIPTFSPKKLRISREYRLWIILLIVSLLIVALEQPWWVWVVISNLYIISLPCALWLFRSHHPDKR